MAVAHDWRGAPRLEGPFPLTRADIADVNRVFSEAFTERYRRDGMVGVRVPHLSHSVWRYAIEDADGGAMLWRGDRGEVAAFNIAHHSGREGWMGPLAVGEGYQGVGAGKMIVRTAVEWLKDRGATVIGLETMPRTMDNIGFYSQMGFEPGKLTLTVTLEAVAEVHASTSLSALRGLERGTQTRRCLQLLDSCMPGYDFTREIRLTSELGLGDTVLAVEHGELRGFAVCHIAPLVEGRAREELRVLKLVCDRGEGVDLIIRAARDHACRSGARRVAFRVQSDYIAFYKRLIELGGRVRWSDLRMSAPGFAERPSENGVVLSNWEI